jgi:ABC-type lipoprotein release transport system permease subunit
MRRLWWRYLTASPRRSLRLLVYLGIGSVAASTWAWLAVSAVFGGFSQFLEEVFQRVDPHLRIEGPGLTPALKDELSRWPDIKAIAGVYEGMAVLRHGERQLAVRLRGIEPGYELVSGIGSHLVAGEGFPLRPRSGLIGSGVAAALALSDTEHEEPVWLYLVSSVRTLAMSGEAAIQRKSLSVQGIFSVQKDYDESWVIVRAEEIPLWREAPYTMLEIRLHDLRSLQLVKAKLRRTLGPAYMVKDPRAQHADVYRVLAQERLLSQWGLGLMLVLVAGGVLSVLAALLIYHRRDWAVYQALGASENWRYRLLFGLAVGVIGGGFLGGALIGSLTVWTQARFHWLKLRGGEGFLIQHFPVKLSVGDYLVLIALLSGLLVVIYFYLLHLLRRFSLRALLQGD